MAVGRIGYRGEFWIYYDTNNVRRAFKGTIVQDPFELDNANFGQEEQDGFVYKDGSNQWRLMDGNEVDNDQVQSDGSIPRGIGVRGILFYYNGPTVLDRIRGDIDDQDTSVWADVFLSVTDEGESATLGWSAGTIRHLTRTFDILRKEETEASFSTIATGITGVSGNTYTDTPPEEGVWEYRVRERRTLSTGSQQIKLSNIYTVDQLSDDGPADTTGVEVDYDPPSGNDTFSVGEIITITVTGWGGDIRVTTEIDGVDVGSQTKVGDPAVFEVDIACPDGGFICSGSENQFKVHVKGATTEWTSVSSKIYVVE